MKTSPIAMISVILAALLLSGVGYAYATNSSVFAPNNGVDASAHSIDIVSVGDIVSGMVVPEPYHTGANIAPDQVLHIEGYSLSIEWNDEPSYVRAWLYLDAGAWLYVDHVTLTIGGNTYDFDNGGDTGCATDAITGLVDGTHAFTIDFHYKSGTIDYQTYDDSTSIWNNGASLTFADGLTDPVPTS